MRCVSAVLIGLIVPATVSGKALPERFTLGKYVPGDVWLYLHGVHNPETDWLESEWAEVIASAKATGLEKDVMQFAMSFVPEGKQAEYRGEADKWFGLLKAVRWSDMLAQEFVFAERMLSTPKGPMNPMGVDYILLARGKDGTGEQNFAALTAIVREVSKLSEKLKLEEDKPDGIERITLRIILTGNDGPGELAVSVFRRSDIVALTNSKRTSDEVIDLMLGRSKQAPITASPRLAQALAQVPAPEDFLSYFDAKTMLGSISEVLTRAVSASGAPTEEGKKTISLITKLLGKADVFDYMIASVETKGHQQLTHSVTRFQEGKQSSEIAKLIVNRKPFTRFDEYVPAEATNFSVDTFLDLEGAYNAVLDFIQTEVEGGAGMIEQWNGLLAGIGFDPRKDLFSWWSGEMVSIEMPAAIVTPMGGSDSVLMIRVKDSELASTRITGWIEKLQNLMKEQGQPLMVMPAQVNAEGFKQVTHPMIMMYVNPVIGVKDNWLMIATSAGGLNRCLQTAAGEHPRIVENERFKREGLVPKQPVLSCSFSDTSRFGEELAGAVGMAGFVGGMVTAGIPDDAESGPKKKAFQSVMQMVMKLAPILQRLDFYSSEASMVTYDGNLTLHTEHVVTYKEPAAEKVKTAAGKP
jgi:hypothetical protein